MSGTDASRTTLECNTCQKVADRWSLCICWWSKRQGHSPWLNGGGMSHPRGQALPPCFCQGCGAGSPPSLPAPSSSPESHPASTADSSVAISLQAFIARVTRPGVSVAYLTSWVLSELSLVHLMLMVRCMARHMPMTVFVKIKLVSMTYMAITDAAFGLHCLHAPANVMAMLYLRRPALRC